MTDTDHQHSHQHQHGHRRGHGTGPMDDPERYERRARAVARLYRRVARDVAGLGLPDGARVLDVGTGPGTVPRLIAAAAPGLQIDGIDIAPEMITWAQRTATPGVIFTVADVGSLPWPDATFDLVVSSLSQHHWPDPAAGLAEIRRVLRPGGQAWVYDFRRALRKAHPVAESALTPGTTAELEGTVVRLWWFYPISRLVLRAP